MFLVLMVLLWMAYGRFVSRLLPSELTSSASTMQSSKPSRAYHIMGDGLDIQCPVASPLSIQQIPNAGKRDDEQGEFKRDTAPESNDSPGEPSLMPHRIAKVSVHPNARHQLRPSLLSSDLVPPPAPTLNGTNPACKKWYTVLASNNNACGDTLAQGGLPLELFRALNSDRVNEDCTNLMPGYAYCIAGE